MTEAPSSSQRAQGNKRIFVISLTLTLLSNVDLVISLVIFCRKDESAAEECRIIFADEVFKIEKAEDAISNDDVEENVEKSMIQV